jgi:hypothetical protein
VGVRLKGSLSGKWSHLNILVPLVLVMEPLDAPVPLLRSISFGQITGIVMVALHQAVIVIVPQTVSNGNLNLLLFGGAKWGASCKGVWEVKARSRTLNLLVFGLDRTFILLGSSFIWLVGLVKS